MTDIVRAPAKLTVSLRVVGRRSDGFHLLDAEMVALDLAGELVFERGDGLDVIDEVGVGLPVPADEDNLVRRALRLVGRSAHVTLHKRIPAGGGLGGGSADAAAVLRWAGVRDVAIAAQLGADVPFCLLGGCRARIGGIGDEVHPLPSVERTFTLLTPPVACPTPEVYQAWDEMGGPTHPCNDLEPAALAVRPQLAFWRDQLARSSGRSPCLAGSGSTWFVEGAFPGPGRVVARTDRPEGRSN